MNQIIKQKISNFVEWLVICIIQIEEKLTKREVVFDGDDNLPDVCPPIYEYVNAERVE